MAHFAPIPDPYHPENGMSWLTPVVREVMGDAAATDHKLAFFENAATPNLAVKLSEKLPRMISHSSSRRCGRTIAESRTHGRRSTSAAALTTVVGADMKQLDFKVTQGLARPHRRRRRRSPVIVKAIRGLDASTYSNYGQARRKFADGWARPQWRMAAGALASIVQAPPARGSGTTTATSRSSKRTRRTPRTSSSTDSQSVRQLTDGGYTPESVVKAIDARDITLLEHTGLVPVQLQAPGSEAPALPA